MKIVLETVLSNLDDSPAMEGEKPVTARTALIRATLSDVDETGQAVKGDDKIKRYDLYRKLKKATVDTDFEVEEVAALRKHVLVFPTMTAGQLRDLLSG